MHITNLKQALVHGFVLKNIDMNTKLRKKAKKKKKNERKNREILCQIDE